MTDLSNKTTVVVGASRGLGRGIALAFAKEHQDRLRYDHSIGKWFQWAGKAWRQDETKLAFSWARRT